MHTIIQVIGGAVVAVGVLALIAAGGPKAVGFWITAAYLGPAIFGGLVLFCLGAIMGHLSELRQLTLHQLRLFETLTQQRPKQPS